MISIISMIFIFVIFILISLILSQKESKAIKEHNNAPDNNEEDNKKYSNIYEKLEKENNETKIKNYIEQMTLFELTQLLPDDIFTKIPKKREAIEQEVFNKVISGDIVLKNNNLIYYVDSDKIAENDKEYYYKDIKEKKDDIKHFEPITKNDGISKQMTIFNTENDYIDIDTKIKDKMKENQNKKLEQNENTLEEKIKYAITLEPTKQNYLTFKLLLDEYNSLDFDNKLKINRKYTSQLESLKNKAERA